MSWTHHRQYISVGYIGSSATRILGGIYTTRNADGTVTAQCRITNAGTFYSVSGTVDIYVGSHMYTGISIHETATYKQYESDEFTITGDYGPLDIYIIVYVTSGGSISGHVKASLDVRIKYAVNGVDAESGTSVAVKLGRQNTITITDSLGLSQSTAASDYSFLFSFEYVTGSHTTAGVIYNDRETIQTVLSAGNVTTITFTPSQENWSPYMQEIIRISMLVSCNGSTVNYFPLINTPSGFAEALQILPVLPTDPSTIFAHIKTGSTQDVATLGTAATINISQAEYTNTVQLIVNGTVIATPISSSPAISASYTPPLATWAPQSPNSLTFTVTVRLLMYDNGTLVGQTDTYATFTIPSGSVEPACSVSTADPTGYYSTYGAYVLGQSQVKVTATPTLRYGATMAAIRIDANGTNYSYNEAVTDVIASLSYNRIQVQITDSRGLTATTTVSISIVEWYTPQITLSVHRGTYTGGTFTPDDNGRYVKIDVNVKIAPVNNRNTRSVTITAPDGDHSYTPTSYDWNTSLISAASTEYSYTITVEAEDAFVTFSKSTRLSTAGVIMDFKSGGKGVAFGKVAETDNMVEISSDWTLQVYNIKIGNQTLADYIRSIVGS